MRKRFNIFAWSIGSDFFSFWIKRWRVTFLLTALLVFLWTNALITVPKESSPEIEFGIISVTTVYPGTNPLDMDSLITEKIEQEVNDITGVKNTTATSSVGVSSVIIELDTDVDTAAVLNDIRSAVDGVVLPDDASDPVVTEISASNELLFQLLIYGDQNVYTKDTLMEQAQRIQRLLESSDDVARVEFGAFDAAGGVGGSNASYELVLRVDDVALQEMGLTVQQIAQSIRAANVNQPLWRFEIDTLWYDVRIDNSYTSLEDVLRTPVVFREWTWVLVENVVVPTRKYADSSVTMFGWPDNMGNNAVSLIVNKREWEDVFGAARRAKAVVDEIMWLPEFAGLSYALTNDLSAIIIDDYQNLGNSARQTLLIVFLLVVFFIGWKEAAVATLSLPLSFFITFMVLNWLGLSLNFLTNFSLVLTLGIIIDITVVLIEAASEKMKLWFSSKTAMLMSIRDFAKPLIAGTATTIVVFIPLLTLPGIIGKFLAYIPITVFSTLLAALVIGMTITPAIFVQIFRRVKTYTPDEQVEQFLTAEDKEILAFEREGKELVLPEWRSWREKVIHGMGVWYADALRGIITNVKARWAAIITPFILLILTFVFLAPQIGFTLFPAGDSGRFTLSVTFPPGTLTQETARVIPLIEATLVDAPELDQYFITASNNRLSVDIDLLDAKERRRAGQRNVFEVESALLEDLQFLLQEGALVDSAVQAWWPPQTKPVGIKLTAQTNTQFPELIEVAKDFEAYLRSVPGTRNVERSSADVPGQFVYRLYTDFLAFRGLTVAEVAQEINMIMNGVTAGTLTVDGEDVTLRVQSDRFVDAATPDDVWQLILSTRQWPVNVSNVMDYSLENAVGAISRENTNITITVDADVDDDMRNEAGRFQQQLLAFARSYDFPDGLSYRESGESAENAELIQAVAIGFVIAVVMIFAILVLEFNSYAQPLIILYSVVMGLIGINIWLFLTGTPYSMSFAIWLIAMTGIVVDNAVVYLERVNENISRDIDPFEAIIEAWRSRLAPIMLTSLTDTLGLIPIALQDPFWQWLAFTIGFGLITGSLMTLFVTPHIFYLLYQRKQRQQDDA